jgi:hypothetical protein
VPSLETTIRVTQTQKEVCVNTILEADTHNEFALDQNSHTTDISSLISSGPAQRPTDVVIFGSRLLQSIDHNQVNDLVGEH